MTLRLFGGFCGGGQFPGYVDMPDIEKCWWDTSTDIAKYDSITFLIEPQLLRKHAHFPVFMRTAALVRWSHSSKRSNLQNRAFPSSVATNVAKGSSFFWFNKLHATSQLMDSDGVLALVR